MNDRITPPSMDWIPGTGFDHFGEDDYSYDDLTTMVVASEVGQATPSSADIMFMQGNASARTAASAVLTLVEAKVMEHPIRLATPPRLLASWVARMLMSKKQYKLHWGPIVADMLDEYYECLAEGDEWAARRAVVRHNLQAIPRWLKVLAWSLALRALDWLKGG